MPIPPWRELPWPHLVRGALIYVGGLQLAKVAGTVAFLLMSWVGRSEWVGYACQMITTLAVFHRLLEVANE